MGNGERVRLDHYVARIDRLSGARVRIDVGREDGTRLDQLYEVRDVGGQPVGRLVVVEVGRLTAWTLPVEQGVSLHEGMSARLSKSSASSASHRTNILVINFSAKSANDAETRRAGETIAAELSTALAEAAGEKTGTKVSYAANAVVHLGGTTADMDEQVRAIGRRHNADIVVWGSMRCGKRACALPRFTVVKPNALARDSSKMHQLWVDRDDAGFTLGEKRAKSQASAILGRLTYDAQRYPDAAYYLARALGGGALTGIEALRGRAYLSEALYHSNKGQTEARLHAQRLIAAASVQLKTANVEQANDIRNWSRWGKAQLAELDAREGNVARARRRYRALQREVTKAGDKGFEAYTLHALAILEAQQGRIDEARKLYKQSLALEESIGNVQGGLVTRVNLALLDYRDGKRAEARALWTKARSLYDKLGMAKERDATDARLAKLPARRPAPVP